MLTLYRPGTGWMHRAPAGPKSLVLLVAVLVLSMLPSSYSAAIGSGVVALLGYLVTGLTPREIVRQITSVRWAIAITLGSQLFFLQPEQAVANTSRVLATVLIASLLALTTRIGELLDAVERALRPLTLFGADPARASLILAISITTVPVLVRVAASVREARTARGAGAPLGSSVTPFLVMSLKHADGLGEALKARGVN